MESKISATGFATLQTSNQIDAAYTMYAREHSLSISYVGLSSHGWQSPILLTRISSSTIPIDITRGVLDIKARGVHLPKSTMHILGLYSTHISTTFINFSIFPQKL